ncbi:MAG TPA: hypothetical protein DEA08_13205, partial [Planctomycetes bacterium]|nr:hypothetical protein [Planctomycetota bacterium]
MPFSKWEACSMETLRYLLCSGLLCALVGCSGGSSGGGSTAAAVGSGATTTTSNPTPPTTTSTTSGTGGTSSGSGTSAAAAFALAAPRQVTVDELTSSQTCFSCHSNRPGTTHLRDATGRGVAPYDLWQGSMMANAARDPLWRAEVSVEVAATPSLRGAIEDKCTTCHAPMAHHLAARSGSLLSVANLDNTDRGQLGLDGVSCSFCHQIEAPANVATTFEGHATLNAQREIYGPHSAPFSNPMAQRTGYLPRESSHVLRSAHCASCHTLTTQARRADGSATGGQLHEQSPYLEWRNSVFNDEIASPGPEAASCQACHMPTTDLDGNPIQTEIAGNGGRGFPIQPRDPVGRHVFLGGNTLVPQILRDQRADLQPLASDAALNEVITRTREQLQRRTARVSLGSVTRTGDTLSIPLSVENLSGHKLPTGHPSRRMWLRLVVRDAQGQVVFASGQHDAAGRILDGAGQVLPSEAAGGPHQPHRATIDSGAQVQIYQSLMQDEGSALTFLLLRGEAYLKDNRLLPKGWSSLHADAAATAPAGLGGDADFVGGRDTLRYRVSAPAA